MAHAWRWSRLRTGCHDSRCVEHSMGAPARTSRPSSVESRSRSGKPMVRAAWIRADPRRRGHQHRRQRAARLARRAGVRHRFPGR